MCSDANIKRKEEKIAPARRDRRVDPATHGSYLQVCEFIFASDRGEVAEEESTGVSSLDATLFIGVLPRRALHFCTSTAAPLVTPRHRHYRKTALDSAFVFAGFLLSNFPSVIRTRPLYCRI